MTESPPPQVVKLGHKNSGGTSKRAPTTVLVNIRGGGLSFFVISRSHVGELSHQAAHYAQELISS